MPRGQNPNSMANLKAGKRFTDESATKAAKKATEKRVAKKRMFEEIQRDIVESVFTAERTRNMLNKIYELADQGDKDMLKLYAQIAGVGKNGLENEKLKKDITKTEKETKRIESDTKRIDMETELLKQKLATPEDTADDGFVDAVEGRIADVWGGDDEE